MKKMVFFLTTALTIVTLTACSLSSGTPLSASLASDPTISVSSSPEQAVDASSSIPSTSTPPAITANARVNETIKQLEEGDFSYVVGEYISANHGKAVINSDLSITFYQHTAWNGYYERLTFESIPPGFKSPANLTKMSSSECLYWQIVERELTSGNYNIYLFPEGSETMWSTSINGRYPSVDTDLSKIRFFVFGDEWPCENPNDYFVKQDNQPNEEFPAPPTADISPAEGNSPRGQVVGIYQFGDDLPNDFTLGMASPNLDEAEYSNSWIGVNIKRGELFASYDDIYLYDAVITILRYGAPEKEASTEVEFIVSEDIAIIVADGENGYTPGLAQYLRDLMAEIGG